MAVKIVLLGEVAAHVRGHRVDVGPAKQRCVLAALAVEVNRVIPDDRLIERVWGTDPPLRARATLASYVSRLRQMLSSAEDETGTSPAAMVRRAGGYVLVAEKSSVDLHRFRDLCTRAHLATGDDESGRELVTEALRLWRGEPLTGLDGDWAAAERHRLNLERLDAECDHTDARLKLGQGGQLVAELSARSAEHPLDERVSRQYMLALYRSGRPADALEHYRLLRARLVEELGADPGTSLQLLHQQVLAADPALSANGSPHVGSDTTPRQLPAAPAPFVGRRDELARLDEALNGTSGAGNTVVISALAGTGGIGKTWLALHWAQQNSDRFPDGQLFVDLRGFSPDSEPMSTAVAMRGFLDALGIEPDRIPAAAHAQAALFRSLTTGKRMLMVLDNAVDTDHVLPLLPGSQTCTVLVTSRNRLSGLVTGHGARHLSLDVLSEDEARALLTSRLDNARIGTEEEAADELIRLCGGFPLALSIVAGHAHIRPRLPLTALAAELRSLGLDALDDEEPIASLPSVLSWSHRALTAEQARMFALLAIAPGPDIGLPAAASLAGLSSADTRTVLRGLEQASLVVRDMSGRYRMHDLIRLYAADTADQLPAQVRETALRRGVDFYVHTAHTGDLILEPHRPNIQLGTPAPGCHPVSLPDDAITLTWFDGEHPNLLAALHIAAGLGWHQAVWQLARSLETFLARRGHQHDRLTAWKAGAAAADQLADTGAQVAAHRYLGRALIEVGRYDQALDRLNHALALAEHINDPIQQAFTLGTLARLWELSGDDRQALEHAALALDLYRTLAEPVWESRALNQVGWYAARLGHHDQAREHCQAALVLQRQHHYRQGEAATLDSLGYIAHHTGDHDLAIRHYRQALPLYREIGDTCGEANTLDRLGHPHAALGHYEQACAVWQEALNCYRAQHRPDDADRVQEQLDVLRRAGPIV